MITEIVKLTEEGLLHFFEGCHFRRRLLVQSHLLSGHQTDALIQGILHGTAEVHIHGCRPLPGFPVMGHHTAAVVPVPGVLRLIAGIQQHLVSHRIAVNGRETGTLRHQCCHRIQKFLRAGLGYPDREPRLMGLHLTGGLQCHVGDRIRAVAAVPFLSAHRQVLELVISGEVVRRVGGDRPYPFRILQPQSVHQFLTEIRGNAPRRQIRLVERVRVLVEPARIQGQWIFGQNAADLDEPHELKRFVEGLRRILRHLPAICRNHPEFLPPDFILLLRRHPLRFLRIAISITDDAPGGQDHRIIEFFLFFVFRLRQIQLPDMLFRFPDDAAESLREQLILIIRGHFSHRLPPLRI